MQIISKAPSSLRDSLTSSKWEVIAYLSGVPIQKFCSREPEWYIAMQDILASLDINERVEAERAAKENPNSP